MGPDAADADPRHRVGGASGPVLPGTPEPNVAGPAAVAGPPAVDAPDHPHPPAREVPGGLRRLAARGTLINAAFMVGLQTLSLLKGFIVAAFITAAGFGIWGILVITLGTLGKLKEVGISDKYVQQDEDDQELAFQKAFTLELLAGAALLVLVVVAIPIFAMIYGQSEIIAPGYLLAAAVPAIALQSPAWVYYRQMRFVRQRALEAVEPVVSFAVTIPLAILDFSYWSLVIGLFVGRWASAGVALAVTPYRLSWKLDAETTREYFRFSWPLFGAALLALAVPQLSLLVGEAVLGLAAAGVIALAGSIIVYTDRVDAIVTQALYPAICAVRDRTDLLYEAFVKSNRLALMWGVPFGVAVALYADDLVTLVLGEQWRDAVGLLQVWGLIAAVNHIGFNWSAFYRARGETRPTMVVTAVGVVVLVATIVPLTIALGLEGFALSIALMTVAALVGRGYFLVRLFPGFALARHAVRAIAPTVPAALVVLGLRALTDVDRTLAVAAGELAVYLAVTVAATVVLERALLREVVGYVRGSAPEPLIAR